MEIKRIGQGGQVTSELNVKNINGDLNIQENSTNDKVVTEPNDENKKYDEKDIKKAVDKMNKIFEDTNTHVEYEIHKVFGDIIIKFVDNDTKEVISEVPPKKVLDMVAKICELAGVIVNEKA